MKKTAITNIYPYLKGSYPIGMGTTSICYLMKDKRVLKVFLNTSGTYYLFTKFQNLIDHLEKVNSLKNNTYVVPEELLIKDGKLVAYIYDYVDSRTFKHIRLNTKIDTLLYGYDKLYEDTVDISNKGFCLYDLNDKNILFNGFYHIIDLDKGTFEGLMTKENILKTNMKAINNTLINSLFRVNDDELINFYNDDLKKSYTNNILKDYKGMKSFLKDIQKYEKNINKVSDLKFKTNSLRYTIYNDYYRHN